MRLLTLTALVVATAATQSQEPDVNTASQTSAVYAAQATAPTSKQTSHVRGKAFDRFITIWLENTDYKKAEGNG